ncbi:MAG: hypothetical protein ACI9C1_004104 [Candidatus Aldehydirespiratoraceae bacterium]|jgi:hypothetical protein
MTFDQRAPHHTRLAELVVELAGARTDDAQQAIDVALSRNGDTGDQLINIADAIISLRHDPAACRAAKP